MMEYMDGGSLQEIVDAGGCDDEEVLANISIQALIGLAFLHNCSQIHRLMVIVTHSKNEISQLFPVY
jgi:serine/threonine protein kinase